MESPPYLLMALEWPAISSFSKAEERIHSNYDIGQAQTMNNGSQIKLGGVQIGRDPDGTLRISQEAYIENLSNIKAHLHNDLASVRTARGKVSWIASWTRPDLAFAMERLSQITPTVLRRRGKV
jgi:hypothetical protein